MSAKKKPSREQVLAWQQKKFDREWDKLYMQVYTNSILQGLMNEGGCLVFNDFDELAMYACLPSKAYAQYCFIQFDKKWSDKICSIVSKKGDIVIEEIPF